MKLQINKELILESITPKEIQRNALIGTGAGALIGGITGYENPMGDNQPLTAGYSALGGATLGKLAAALYSSRQTKKI